MIMELTSKYIVGDQVLYRGKSARILKIKLEKLPKKHRYMFSYLLLINGDTKWISEDNIPMHIWTRLYRIFNLILQEVSRLFRR